MDSQNVTHPEVRDCPRFARFILSGQALALALVTQWTIGHGLTLHPTKTKIVDSRTSSFAFRGDEFPGENHWPRKKRLQKLKDTIREKTRRTTGDSLPCVVAKLNRTLRGRFAYFQHSSYRQTDQFVHYKLGEVSSYLPGTGRPRGLAIRSIGDHSIPSTEIGNAEGAEGAETAISPELCVLSVLCVSIPPAPGVRMFNSGCRE